MSVMTTARRQELLKECDAADTPDQLVLTAKAENNPLTYGELRALLDLDQRVEQALEEIEPVRKCCFCDVEPEPLPFDDRCVACRVSAILQGGSR